MHRRSEGDDALFYQAVMLGQSPAFFDTDSVDKDDWEGRDIIGFGAFGEVVVFEKRDSKNKIEDVRLKQPGGLVLQS